MTEAEWVAGRRAVAMLLAVRDRVTERKVLLFNIACCRRVWGLLGDEDRAAVALADGAADDPEAVRRWHSRYDPERAAQLSMGGLKSEPVSPDLAALLTSQSALRTRLDGTRNYGIGSLAHEAGQMAGAAVPASERPAATAAEERWQADLAREVFGPLPFRPVTIDPSRLTSPVLALAGRMYDARDFSPMPILADALQDAGCDNEDVLGHCRGSGLHVRGCWIVDLILGKE